MQTTRTADAMTTTAAAMQYKADWELREMLDEVENSLSILRTQMQRAADTHNQTWYTAIQRQMAPLDDQRRELKAALDHNQPTPEPPTTTTTATRKRPSREAQHNAKVQAAYDSIRDMGHDTRNDLHELFSVASGSLNGLRYTVTHDTVTGRLHCTCLAGQHERGTCVHRQAVTRWLNERAVKINKAADRAIQQRLADVQRDTSPLRRSSKPFSMMA